MHTPLYILFVSIPGETATQLSALLRLEGFDPVEQRVYTPEALDHALDQYWDVLLADFSAQLSIDAVVQALKSRTQDVPLIVISGDTDEAVLVNAMRAGAQDFVFRDKLERLVPAIQRERAAAIQRAEQRDLVVSEHLLQEIDHLILDGYDSFALMNQVCLRIVELFGFRLAWIGLKGGDGAVELSAAAAAGKTDYLDHLDESWDVGGQSRGVVGLAIREGRSVVVKPGEVDYEAWHSAIVPHLSVRSMVALPLGGPGQVIGALALYSVNGEIFGEAALQRLAGFASRITVAMLVAQEQQLLRLLQQAMNNAATAMFITRTDGSIEWMNEALTQYSGYGAEELRGRTLRVLDSGQQDKTFWIEMWQTLQAGKVWRGDVVNRHKDGHLYTVNQTVSPLCDHAGKLTHYMAIQQDVSEKKRLEQEIRFLAYHDALTGLPNRILFQDRVQQAIVQAERNSETLALMFIDLDGFKAVNDTHGHAKGDELLQQASERMKSCVRSGDTVARLGGDEFTVLLLDVQELVNVFKVAHKLLQVIAQPFDLGDDSVVSVTLSIGIGMYPQDGKDFDMLISHADHAMYRAKQGGKNRYEFCRADD
ncbi:MAG: diguanylate cyclase [Nitrosomonadales bacterium]|nr:diguanylate cyclase [Nitrosomonadales bacterium]